MCICIVCIYILFIAVAMNGRDQCEIIGLCEILHSIKQPRSSFCPKKVLECITVAETMQYHG